MKETILTCTRLGLAGCGGAVAARGWMSETEFEQLAGAVLTIIAVLWGIWSARNTRPEA